VTRALFPTSASAVTCSRVGAVTKVDQIIKLGIDDQNDISALSTVSTVWASFGHKLFA
jgi:hypothetical protein